jgi:23S rRNA pseudouridine1911/1915/1917 synthase
MKYKIKKTDNGKRLDVFLAAKLKNKSRSEIQKMIKAEMVLIDGTQKSSHYALKEGEAVEVKRLNLKIKKEKFLPVEPEIICDNKEFLVVNKPAGLIVHGAAHIKGPTLADWLVKKYPKLKEVGEDKARPGIMHRLDKDASGLMVIAKTNESFFSLKKQFQKREVDKEYIALAYGEVKKDFDQINFSLRRSSGGHRQAAIPKKYNFNENYLELREAETEFVVSKRFINYTLLAVKIKSGRKHQIRAHMFAYGYPLVGDNLYSTKKTRELNRRNGLNRIFLQAAELSFVDLAGKKHQFSIELAPELQEFLEKIK